ncbi:hypothetical protein [Carnobacterium sp. TMP28]
MAVLAADWTRLVFYNVNLAKKGFLGLITLDSKVIIVILGS